MAKKKSRKKRGLRHKRGDKYRGKGSRGGVGKAGRGKRGQHRRANFPPLGKKGFVPKGRKLEGISLRRLNELIKKENLEGKEVDLLKYGYNKLIGSGELDYKVKIIVKKATAKAIEKVKQAKGEVIIR